MQVHKLTYISSLFYTLNLKKKTRRFEATALINIWQFALRKEIVLSGLYILKTKIIVYCVLLIYLQPLDRGDVLLGFRYLYQTQQIICYKNGPELPTLNFKLDCAVHGRCYILQLETGWNKYPVGYVTNTVVTEICEVIVTGILKFKLINCLCNKLLKFN